MYSSPPAALCLPPILKVTMKTSSLAAALVLGLTGTAAFAQATHSGWYVAPTASVVINDNDRVKSTGAGVGLAVGKMLNEKWNVEVASQYLQLDGKNDEQANIGVDGLYFFNRNPNFAPYALAGLAYAREGYSDADKNNNLMARVGLGFTKQLTKNVDFRSDLRYQYHGNKAGSGSLGDWIVSAGLNIAFGGTPQAAAPAYVAPAYVAPAPVYVAPAPAPAYVAPAPAPTPAPYVAPKREPKQDRN
jgi:OOP family OmpA-OmpF porin